MFGAALQARVERRRAKRHHRRGRRVPGGGAMAGMRILAIARARGTTAVVTLEPCNHTGRTGPCSEALIAAGVARVVYAQEDPNPQAAGIRNRY